MTDYPTEPPLDDFVPLPFEDGPEDDHDPKPKTRKAADDA